MIISTSKNNEDFTIELTALLTNVRDYDSNSFDLKKSHHFLFGKYLFRNKSCHNVILMGFNPGETNSDWVKTNGERSEESFQYDFHSSNPTSAAKRWNSAVDYFLPNSNIVSTEFFFWSTPNIKDLVKKYGPIDPSNCHLNFCIDINSQLIKLLKPDLIIFTGISHASIVAKMYELHITETITENNSKIAISAHDKHKNKWIFTKHWTGSFGFSKDQKTIIKNLIDSHF
jgi:hypothetical protein